VAATILVRASISISFMCTTLRSCRGRGHLAAGIGVGTSGGRRRPPQTGPTAPRSPLQGQPPRVQPQASCPRRGRARALPLSRVAATPPVPWRGPRGPNSAPGPVGFR
jgi:hypothetical protein